MLPGPLLSYSHTQQQQQHGDMLPCVSVSYLCPQMTVLVCFGTISLFVTV